jgi:hypothetical protein
MTSNVLPKQQICSWLTTISGADHGVIARSDYDLWKTSLGEPQTAE